MLNLGIKRKPISHQLSEMCGGEWKYDNRGSWTCKAHPTKYVKRVHTGGYDMNGEPMPGSGYQIIDTEKKTVDRLRLVKPNKTR